MPLTKIEHQLKILDYDWFSNKKKWFKKETFYSSGLDKIYESYIDTVYDDDTADDVETVIDIDLQQYCWSSHYPNSLSGNEQAGLSLPIDSSDVAEEIIKEVSALVSQSPDNETQHRIITSVVSLASDQIENFKQMNKDEEYHKVLDDFLIRLRQGLGSKFRAVKNIYTLSKDYPEKERLEFNLNQEELGVLLYILNTAGVIHTPSPTDTTFLNFCSERFYFKNQKTKSFTKATGLRNRYNDAKQLAGKARENVIALLKKALKDV